MSALAKTMSLLSPREGKKAETSKTPAKTGKLPKVELKPKQKVTVKVIFGKLVKFDENGKEISTRIKRRRRGNKAKNIKDSEIKTYSAFRNKRKKEGSREGHQSRS